MPPKMSLSAVLANTLFLSLAVAPRAGAQPATALVAAEQDAAPVFLELLPNNTVFIAHSFAEDAANNLRQAVLCMVRAVV
jgi:hypothetical protein